MLISLKKISINKWQKLRYKILQKSCLTHISPNLRSNLRLVFVSALILLGFAVIAARLAILGLQSEEFARHNNGNNVKNSTAKTPAVQVEQVKRPVIKDRNHRLLAKDVAIDSLYATPHLIPNPDEIQEELSKILPKINKNELRRKLNSNSKFVWLKRGITKTQRKKIFALGFPWLKFKQEIKRIYPNGRFLAHVLGYTDINNKGKQGIEAYIDRQKQNKQEKKEIILSLDSKLNYIACSELQNAIKIYEAQAAGAIMLDITNGEVLVFCSLPDFDPNQPETALQKNAINRVSNGVFEFGSIMKIFTYTMAMTYNQKPFQKIYDVSQTLSIKGFKVKTIPTKDQFIDLEQGFITSNNIVAANIALEVGVQKHYQFLQKFGLFDDIKTEIRPNASAIIPKKWNEISSVSAAFGYGIAISPLQFTAAAATLLNGGWKVNPSFIKNNAEKNYKKKAKLLPQKTVEQLHKLLRLNVLKGTAQEMGKIKLKVGGKTGTAQRIVDGKYSDEEVLASFISLFPMQAPKYLLFVMLDEPKAQGDDMKHNSASYNAVPLAAKIIERFASTMPYLAGYLHQKNDYDENIIISGFSKNK